MMEKCPVPNGDRRWVEQAIVPVLLIVVFGAQQWQFESLNASISEVKNDIKASCTETTKQSIQIEHLKEFRLQVIQRWASKDAHHEQCERERKAMSDRLLHLEHICEEK